MTKDLVNELYASEDASDLTSRAAFEIEKLRRELLESENLIEVITGRDL